MKTIIAILLLAASAFAQGTGGGQSGTGGGGAGTVTSVAFVGDGVIDSATPSTAVTSSGNVTASVLSYAGSCFIASPAGGASGALSCRGIVAGDVPTLNQNTTGTALNLSGTQTQNFFYAAPSGSSGVGGWRAIVATDLPTTLTSGTAITNAALTTPSLGVATATSINGLTISTTTGTFTLTNAKTLSVSNTLTFAGTDSTTMTFPASSTTVLGNSVANTAAAGMTLNLSAESSSSGFVIPNIAGGTSGTLGALTYDTTAKNTHMTQNGADALVVGQLAGITQNRILKSGSATISLLTATSLTDAGTTVVSAENFSFGTAAGLPNIDLTIGSTTAAMGAQSTATCTNITGMSWLVAANKNYVGHCQIPVTFAASATIAFCLNGPGSPTDYDINAVGSIGAAGVYDDINVIGAGTTWGTKTAASGAVGSGSQIILVDFFVRNGATASGTALTLQTAANGTNNITILANAACDVKQVN